MKIGISLEEREYLQLEADRKKLGLQRSRAIREALKLWHNRLVTGEQIRRYEAGYARHPESPKEVRALEKAAAQAFTDESWE